jgi:hypothetical protein
MFKLGLAMVMCVPNFFLVGGMEKVLMTAFVLVAGPFIAFTGAAIPYVNVSHLSEYNVSSFSNFADMLEVCAVCVPSVSSACSVCARVCACLSLHQLRLCVSVNVWFMCVCVCVRRCVIFFVFWMCVGLGGAVGGLWWWWW